jgi:hypothetical protein
MKKTDDTTETSGTVRMTSSAGRMVWAVVCTADHGILPQVQRFGYERAGATIREVDSSNLVMLSQPAFVVDTIREIVGALG